MCLKYTEQQMLRKNLLKHILKFKKKMTASAKTENVKFEIQILTFKHKYLKSSLQSISLCCNDL